MSRLLVRPQEQTGGEDFLWAAHRQAVSGLALAPAAHRVLPGIVAARGFRVCRLSLAQGLPPQGSSYSPRAVERLVAWRLARRFEPHLAGELARGNLVLAQRAVARDAPRPRHVPHPATAPVENERRESA
jgi:hypothetical protein